MAAIDYMQMHLFKAGVMSPLFCIARTALGEWTKPFLIALLVMALLLVLADGGTDIPFLYQAR